MELALILLAIAVVAGAAILAFALRKPAAVEPAGLDPRLDEVIRGQGAIAEQFRQTSAQVEALKARLGESLSENATKTAETLGGIGARLTVIDEAQKNISALSGQVVSLQQVLSNKQARGAFGQAQMEEIVHALRFPVHPFQPQPARLHHPHSRQQGAAGDRRQVSAGRL
jgi:DNA recombination protein RmuC